MCVCLVEIVLPERQDLEQVTTRDRREECVIPPGGPWESLGLAVVATNVYWAACVCW